MAARSLDLGTTIIDVAERLNSLKDGDSYVRQVYGNLVRRRRDLEEDLQVRIGITGGGRAPHYRIELEGTTWDSGCHCYNQAIFADITRAYKLKHGIPVRPNTTYVPGETYGMFDGRTHKRFQQRNDFEIEAMLREENWSRQASSLDEVSAACEIAQLEGKVPLILTSRAISHWSVRPARAQRRKVASQRSFYGV